MKAVVIAAALTLCSTLPICANEDDEFLHGRVALCDTANQVKDLVELFDAGVAPIDALIEVNRIYGALVCNDVVVGFTYSAMYGAVETHSFGSVDIWQVRVHSIFDHDAKMNIQISQGIDYFKYLSVLYWGPDIPPPPLIFHPDEPIEEEAA